MHAYSRLFTKRIGFLMLAADKGGGGGGEGSKSPVDELKTTVTDQAGEITRLKSELKASNDKASGLENEKADLNGKLTKANEKVTSLETEKSDLSTKLTTANEKIATLEGTAKTADELATEKAAAHGLAPAPKAPEAGGGGGVQPKAEALYADYDKLKGRERTAFYREHAKVLDAYAEKLAKAQ